MIGQNAHHEPIVLAENKDARRDPKAVGVVPSTTFAGLPYKTKGELREALYNFRAYLEILKEWDEAEKALLG